MRPGDDEVPKSQAIPAKRFPPDAPVVANDAWSATPVPGRVCLPGRLLHRRRSHVWFPDAKIPDLWHCSRCGVLYYALPLEGLREPPR